MTPQPITEDQARRQALQVLVDRMHKEPKMDAKLGLAALIVERTQRKP